MWHELKVETLLDGPVERLFEFFSDAGNLEAITPPSLKFTIITPKPIAMHRGTLIDYRLRIGGVWMRWRTEITEWDPPHAFTDTQLQGPYRSWTHRHSFEPWGDRILMRDHVRYQLPLFPFGEIAYPIVALQLRSIFKFRGRMIQTLV